MKILPRVLLLAACLPLLQPTGFCVCKVGGSDAAAPRATGPVAAPEKAPRAGCCSACRHPSPADRAVPTPPAEPTPQPSAPAEDSHSPGCPAAVGVDRFQWVGSVPLLVHELPPVEAVALPPIEPAGFATPRAAPFTPRAAAPPLYLSHCSFVI